LDPVAVAAPLDMWPARIAMFCQPFRDPLVDTALGILDQSAFGRGPDDRLVGGAGSRRGQSAPKKLAIVAIAYDEPIVRVIQREPLRDRFYRVGQSPLDPPQGDLRVFARSDIAPRADHFDRLTVSVVDEVPVIAHPAKSTVLLTKSVLDGMATLLEQVAKLGLYCGEVVGMHTAPPEIRALQILVGLVPQQILYVVADECRPV